MKEKPIQIDREDWEQLRRWLIIKKMAPYKKRYFEILKIIGEIEEEEIPLIVK